MVTHSGSTATLGAVYPLIDDSLTVVVYDISSRPDSGDEDSEGYMAAGDEAPLARFYPGGETVSSVPREELMAMDVEEISIIDLMEANAAQGIVVYVSRKNGGKD